MAITINGSSNTITGLAVGGLPDGIVDTDMLAANAVTAAKATGSAKGITMADQWRLNANATINGAAALVANWERVDNTNWSGIGTGMSESSGIFSFPTTGIYLVQFQSRGYSSSGARSYAGVYIQTGVSGTYTNVADAYDSGSADYYYFNIVTSTIFDVTNTSTHTVRLNVDSSGVTVFTGSSNKNETFVTFIRLGDT